MKLKLLKVALMISIILFGTQLSGVEAASLSGETTANLNVRSTPSTQGKVIKTLPKGTKVSYEAYNKTWHKVYLDNRTYYAAASYIKKLSSGATVVKQATTTTGVTTENLNVRVSSHRDAKVFTTLKKGTTVQYASHNSSWAKVFLNGKTYYAAKAYIAPKLVQASPAKKVGYTNQKINLHERTLQSSKIVKTVAAKQTVTYSIHNSSWSIVYEGTKTYYTPTRGITAGTLKPESVKNSGVANRELKLFGERNQSSNVLKVLPKDTIVVSTPYNTSWSIVYLGNDTFYTATAWITPSQQPPTAPKPPTTPPPVETKQTGYANRDANLFGKTHQASPVLLTLPTYTAVTYEAHNASWSKVYIGSATYYTPSSWLTKGKAPAAPAPMPQGKVYINTPGDVLNVRASASASAAVLGRLTHGTQVEHYGSANGFYKIKYNGRDGFIATAYTQSLKPSASKGPVIVLDPGHGGKDPGAINGTFYEKNVVLDVSLRVEKYLREKYGYTVKLTRSTDIFIERWDRAPLAKSMGGNVLISMHNNADPKKKADGIETFYSLSTNQTAKSRSLATSIQNNLVSAMSSSGMKSRGVKTANYTVITHNLMPSALVELGFITSSKDVALLRNGTSRQKMAEGVAEGIAQYVKANF